MSAEVAAFMERAALSVTAAENQLADGMPEFAASRAYYAMFYAASALLAVRGLSLAKHSGVIGKFGELFARTGELPTQLHRHLLDAFQVRQVADYAVLRHVTGDEAALHISRAREFLAATREYLHARGSGEGD
jgi:uncharacterized protein (UPF0332 family)